jgi:two-component system, NarL family, sensor histidine kinase DegS
MSGNRGHDKQDGAVERTLDGLSHEALLALVEGGERRLARFGYDVHDGPLQELLLLADDLHLFREQLDGLLDGRAERAIALGRLDDLEGRLVVLESGLRRISTSVHAGGLIDRPFVDSLGEIVDAFATRSGIRPRVRLGGEPDALSPSQRIALLSVVGEALNNVREHARGVRSVAVSIDCATDATDASVVDDGCGFDVEHALVSAARRGRMGLAGIHERVRLLGGRCVVDSRPGGPTSVVLRLPRWEPTASAPDAARAASVR